MKINHKEVAVIGDGGGKRGCHSVGFLGGFIEHFRQPIFADNEFYFQGCSVGSLNLAFVAQSLEVKGLEKIWKDKIQTGKIKIFNKRTAVRLLRRRGRNAVFDNKDLLQLIKDYLNAEMLIRSPVYFDIAVTNERSGNRLEFFSNKGLSPAEYPTLFKKIAASASLMGAFEPIELDSGLYSDGLNFDVERALARGCKIIFIFHNNHIWLRPDILPEQMDFQRRGRRMSNIAWAREMEFYLELLLWRHPELEIAEHNCLPTPILDIAKKMKRYGKANARLIIVGPQKIVPNLNIAHCGNSDATKAIDNGREAFEKIMKQI